MKTITVDFIMQNRPCNSYTEDRVRELIGNGKTPLEILDLEIPAADKVWVLTRHKVLSKKIQVEFALRCAERALPVFEKKFPNDKRPRTCLEAARKYQNGKLSEEVLKTFADAADAERAAERAFADAADAAERAFADAAERAFAERAFADAADAADAARAVVNAAALAAFAFAFDAVVDAVVNAAYYAAAAADPEQREREKQVADLREFLTGEEKWKR